MLSPIPKLDCSLQLLALFYLAENKGSDLIYVLSKATALIPRHEMVVLIQCLHPPPTTPKEVLPYMDYKGICGPKGHGFSGALVIINRIQNFWSGLK